MSGVKADGSTVYPVSPFDATCTAANTAPANTMGYTTRGYVVPATLPAGRGRDLDQRRVGLPVRARPRRDGDRQARGTFLQSREEVGAIFLNSRYGAVNGTLPMSMVNLEATGRVVPDIIVSYDWDADVMIAGMPGIEYESMSSSNNRGMHGSFSPRDVHNTLLAIGPDFKTGFADTLPSGNVDVAPTMAQILGVSLPAANGRPLQEALAAGGVAIADYTATPSTVNPAAVATGLSFHQPTDLTSAVADPALTMGKYSIDLKIKTLTKGTQELDLLRLGEGDAAVRVGGSVVAAVVATAAAIASIAVAAVADGREEAATGRVVAARAAAASVRWERLFSADGAPALHAKARYRDAGGNEHRLELWRTARALRRDTDARLSLIVERRQGGADEYHVVQHAGGDADGVPGRAYDVSRDQLNRMGSFPGVDAAGDAAHASARGGDA